MCFSYSDGVVVWPPLTFFIRKTKSLVLSLYKNKNKKVMKKKMLMFVLGVGFTAVTACSKDETPAPQSQPTQTQTNSNIPDSLNWTMNFSVPSLGVYSTNMKPYKVFRLVGNNSEPIGRVFFFESGSNNYTVVYDWNQGMTQLSGNINGKSFIRYNVNFINVCQGPQNVPFGMLLIDHLGNVKVNNLVS
jgi:hypothetical protein